MIENSQMPDYSRIEGALNAIGLDLGASEIHGVICGLVCAGTSQSHIDWMAALFQDWPQEDLLAREARELIGELYYVTRDQIGNDDLTFMPYLPDDDQPLSARGKALSAWCEGYLYGLGMSGVTDQQLKGDAGEALQDISHFTRLDYESLESGDATEQAYAELQEFLKVVTLLIWGDLSDVREHAHGEE
jgi:yecA family protein